MVWCLEASLKPDWAAAVCFKHTLDLCLGPRLKHTPDSWLSPHIYRQSFDSLTRPQQQIEPYPTTSCHLIIISAAWLGRAQNKSSHIIVSYELLPTLFSGYVFVCKS